MTLPARIPRKPKMATRWRSQAHLSFVRSFVCANCGAMNEREAAHVRINSGAGIGQKPDDWRAVPLCGGLAGCHAVQHRIGEPEFWAIYERAHGQSVEQLIADLITASPKRFEIEQIRREREDA